jgi:hypothetical protein
VVCSGIYKHAGLEVILDEGRTGNTLVGPTVVETLFRFHKVSSSLRRTFFIIHVPSCESNRILPFDDNRIRYGQTSRHIPRIVIATALKVLWNSTNFRSTIKGTSGRIWREDMELFNCRVTKMYLIGWHSNVDRFISIDMRSPRPVVTSMFGRQKLWTYKSCSSTK